jgi:predicted O-linked N-acetylglucosamine transferase (SPINDLY family)
MNELVATTDTAFVDLAVRLAHDEPACRSLRREIAARREVLFNDVEPVSALERFLEDAARGSRRAPIEG